MQVPVPPHRKERQFRLKGTEPAIKSCVNMNHRHTSQLFKKFKQTYKYLKNRTKTQQKMCSRQYKKNGVLDTSSTYAF